MSEWGVQDQRPSTNVDLRPTVVQASAWSRTKSLHAGRHLPELCFSALSFLFRQSFILLFIAEPFNFNLLVSECWGQGHFGNIPV